MRRTRSLGAVFALPLVIAVVGFVGLVSALTGDGWRDLIAWVGLGIPVAALVWAVRTRRF